MLSLDEVISVFVQGSAECHVILRATTASNLNKCTHRSVLLPFVVMIKRSFSMALVVRVVVAMAVSAVSTASTLAAVAFAAVAIAAVPPTATGTC